MRYLWLAAVIVLLSACAHQTGFGQDANPTKAAKLYTELAGEYLQRGDTERARDKLQLALKQDSDYGPAHGMQALLLLRQQRYEDADREFQRALSLDGKDSETRNNYASFLCNQGETKQAMREFDQVLSDVNYDTPAVALTNAGICALRLPDKAHAESNFRKALQLDPKYTPALAQMAILSYTQGEMLNTRAFLQRYEALALPGRDLLMIGLHVERNLGDQAAAEHYRQQLNQRFPQINTDRHH